MPYDKWFNNPLVLFTAFNGVERKIYPRKPAFHWEAIEILRDFSSFSIYPRWVKKIGSYYVIGIEADPYQVICYSQSLTSGWQIACKESYSDYNDPGSLHLDGTANEIMAVGLHPGDSVNTSLHVCDYNVSWASSPAGSWNTKKIYFKGIIEERNGEETETEGDLTMEPSAMAYGGGQYVINVWQGAHLRMLSASSPGADQWYQSSYIAAGEHQGIVIAKMIYANGEFVACGQLQIEDRTGQPNCGEMRPFIAHTGFPDGRWQSGAIDSSTCSLHDIVYENGMFATIGKDADNKLYAFFAPTASGPWSSRYIADSDSWGSIVYADGYWLISYRGFGEYENPIDRYGTNIPCEHIAITDDLATGRILKYRYERDAYDENSVHFHKPGEAGGVTRLFYENGKLLMVSSGTHILVGDFPFEDFETVYP